MTSDFKNIRMKHSIPDWYDDGMEMVDGRVVFSFCDSSITIHPSGIIEECHMELITDEVSTGFTIPWLPWKS